MNEQAEKLNNQIKENNKHLYKMLSEKGKAIFFPAKGILAQAADAKGKKINATIGIALEEDNSPMRLNSIAKLINLEAKQIFPYAPSFGNDTLRVRWKELIFKKNPSLTGKKISLPIVTNALTHGLSITAYMFVDEGDEIILPDLFWGNYKLILINGYKAKLTAFETFKENKFNVEGLKEKLAKGKGKKIVLLNFPNNPTGYTPTNEEVKEIVSAIKESADKGNDIVVIVDDAYFGLVYKEGIFTESIFAKLCDLHERVLAVKVDGATKEEYVWGLRVGFLTYGIKGINDDLCFVLEQKTSGAVRGTISNVSNLSQNLVLEAFNSESYDKEKRDKYDVLKARADIVEQILSKHPEYKEEFEALPFNSGYFMCIKLKKDAEKVRQALLTKFDTGIIAMKDIIRIAFSSVSKDLLAELFDNIYKACKEV
ncbi:aminotransferase class I/II-fold pyridoxal phosphate-dependent enzyme [Candidatus Woesearchaeota archaeon]|nr:aminotransferase class I/II-fold pyridoxal phosphate-dependent enzyme [Candidatus Woesearchaeota archaeon]